MIEPHTNEWLDCSCNVVHHLPCISFFISTHPSFASSDPTRSHTSPLIYRTVLIRYPGSAQIERMSLNNERGDYFIGDKDHHLYQRCASPLVLCNNLPPNFSLSRPQPRQMSQRQHLDDDTSSNLNQLPKRTVSLGPKRAPPVLWPPTSPSLRKEPILEVAGEFDRKRSSFSRMADELQSSLTELNNLIEGPPMTPKILTKPPKFSSYLTHVADSQADYAQPCDNSPEPSETPRPRDDLADWKASTSVNDLRSIFEQNLTMRSPALDSSLQKPPLSASPNLQRTTKQSPPADRHLGSSDYTIRRTISTSGRREPIRNPYRSYYGN